MTTDRFYVKNPTRDFELEECESAEEAETVAQDLLESLLKYAPEFGRQPDLDALEWGSLVPCGRTVQLGVEQWELRAVPAPIVSADEMRARDNIRVEASSEVHSRYAILLKARELEGAEDAAERVMARNDELEEFVGRFAKMAARTVLQSEPTDESPPPWTPYRDEQKNGDYSEFAAFETWCERSCENFDLSIGDKIWLFAQFMALAAKAEEMPNVVEALEWLPDKEPNGEDVLGPRFKTIAPSEQIRRLRETMVEEMEQISSNLEQVRTKFGLT